MEKFAKDQQVKTKTGLVIGRGVNRVSIEAGTEGHVTRASSVIGVWMVKFEGRDKSLPVHESHLVDI